MPTTNPPTAKVLVQAMAKIVERRTKTKQNLDKAKSDKDALVKKNGSQTERDRLTTKIERLQGELDQWPATYETELKRWLLAQQSVPNGTKWTALPQEIKNEISKYLQTARIRQIEQEILKK